MGGLKIRSKSRAIWRRRYHKLRNICRTDGAMKLVESCKPTNHDWLYPVTGTIDDLVTVIVASIAKPIFCYLWYELLFSFQSKSEKMFVLTFSYAVIAGFTICQYVYRCFKKKKWMDSLDHYPIFLDDIVIPPELLKM